MTFDVIALITYKNKIIMKFTYDYFRKIKILTILTSLMQADNKLPYCATNLVATLIIVTNEPSSTPQHMKGQVSRC